VGLLIGHDDAETLQFNDLDVPDEFFDNFKIESISPPASPDSPVGGFGAQTYCYEIDIPPGEQRRVELTVVATRAGKHSMTFDVCSSYVCSTIWRTVEVKAPE
jgi:hypothetical protein